MASKLLKKDIYDYAREREVSSDKKLMLINSRLQIHPKIQERLINDLVLKTNKDAKKIIAQKIMDLETGALKKIKGTNDYIYDGDKRDKIDAKAKIVKSPIMIYLDLMGKMNELMELLTGHKLTEDEEYPYYTEEHVQYTEKHRIELLKSLDENQVAFLMQKLLTAISAMSNLIDIINQEELIKTDEQSQKSHY